MSIKLKILIDFKANVIKIKDVDECLLYSPCKNDGLCINTHGSYRCKCMNGFAGHNCEIDVDDCMPSELISTIFLGVTLYFMQITYNEIKLFCLKDKYLFKYRNMNLHFSLGVWSCGDRLT